MTQNPYDGPYSSASTQLSAKIDATLKDEFKQACDDRGETMTDAIERLIRADIADGEDGQHDLPDDPQLAEAMRALRSAGPRLRTDAAEAVVSQRCQTSLQAVRAAILDPLESLGWISYHWGTISVQQTGEQRAAADSDPADADDIEDRLEELTDTEATA